VALGINMYSTGQLRSNYYSVVGGFGWLASLVLLALVFIGERRKESLDADRDQTDVEDRTHLHIPRRLEIAIFIGIFLLAFALRVYRLDDWTAGMHGDEGETGMDAISILEGRRVSPFLTGWFSHPNFSFWSVAISMGVFGASLFGLRIFSSILSTLMLIPFYLLVRMWFGTRAAIIATTLLAVMDVSIYFGKLGLNNITTPFFLVVGFYFLFRGLRTRRTLDFVLSGYGFMLTLYFYFGGRLTPIMVAAVLGYLFLFMPIVRIPGAYLQMRRSVPGLSRLVALRDAAWQQARGVLHYAGQLVIFVIACVCMAAPWGVYYLDHRPEMEGRSRDKLILTESNHARMAQQHAATHDPLYLGLRMPRPEDIYPVLPVVFEKTPLSIEIAKDGFWPRAIWGQTTTTLSLFTYRKDESSFYTFTGEPATKPIEAALLVLGIAWALWRWRDSRMATLSIWFWMTVFSGGVLTIDAPYMPRMVGLVPALAIFVAIPLNKICAELIGAVARWRERRKTKDEGRRVAPSVAVGPSPSVSRPAWPVTLAHALTAGVLAGLLGYLIYQNATDYNRYMGNYSYPDVTGQAYFVRQMNHETAAEGRPTPKYYNLGIHIIYWSHGDNRFLNHGTPGQDMLNPSNELPVTNNEGRDVVFMVWDWNRHYLSVLKAYYPEGEEGNFMYGPPGTSNRLFAYYRVKKEHLEARRHTMATYTPADGRAMQREERALGSSVAPPSDLSYPVKANWSGGIVAPAFGRYRFSVDHNGDGGLIIDGTQVLTTTATVPHAETDLVLARGPHDVQLFGTLADAQDKVAAKWLAGGSEFVSIPREYLWYGPGKGLLGQVFPFGGDLLNEAPNPDAEAARALAVRVDGFLGFRHSPDALTGGQMQTRWVGTLRVPEGGRYQFSVNSNGESVVLVDGKPVVSNLQVSGQAREASGEVDLTPGDHRYELRYNWSGGTGYLEAFWTPPGGQREMLGPDTLHAEGGIVDPATLAGEPFPVQLEGESPSSKLTPEAIIGGGLVRPRGLAVDKRGNIYVGDRGNHRIVVFSPDGKVAHSWGKQAPPPQEGQPPTAAPGEFNEINDVAVLEDAGGAVHVYVLDNTPRVQVFTGSGEHVGSYEPEQLGLYGPNGITVGVEQDKAYFAVAATGQNRIAKYPSVNEVKEGRATLPQDQQSVTVTQGDVFEQPVEVVSVTTSDGTPILYVIDLKDRVAEVKRKEEGVGVVGEWGISRQWRVPVGRDDSGSRLAISPDGSTIYMSDIDRRRVAIIELESGTVRYFESAGREGEGGEFRAPSGIAVGADGRLYVLDRERANVQIFTVGGPSR
jgi:4-amino-4-deoxy-L-arabinose transferase-like glycosyltransferase